MNQKHDTPEAKTGLRPVEVFGWASDNFSDSGPPAVIVNPEASAITLLSWGIGQLSQCNAILDAISGMRSLEREGPTEVDRFMIHFTAQAEIVLRAGIEKLYRAPRGHRVPNGESTGVASAPAERG